MSDTSDLSRLPPEVAMPSRTYPKSDLIMGIDLGTTYSCVAIVEDDYPKVIPSQKGGRTTPSIVAVDEKGRLLIGEDAKKQLLINPTNTVYGAKRFIGRHFYSDEVSELSKYFSYRVIPLGDMKVGARLGDRDLSLVQVSAMIMNDLRKNVCEYLKQNVYQAVVSVPAYYSENQREAVREAGRIAEIEVVRIINEPTAAALAYGLNKEYEKKILVYDLGGGTFDASLMELFEDVFKVLSTGGDTFLGGVDFDSRLVDFLLDEYERTENEILQCDSVITQRLKDAAEKAKIELSSKSSALVDLPYITIWKGKFKDFRTDVSVEQLNQLTADLVDRTIQVCGEVLNAAGLQKEDVDNILMVGGQSRMPMVVEKVSQYFGKTPTKGVHPDEVVACGAALFGHSLGTKKSVRLIDVLPMSIGGCLLDGSFKVFFPSNTTLPAEHKIGVTTTYDNQEMIEVNLYQGESQWVAENEYLGSFHVTGFPKAPKGQMRIAVTMSLDQESIMRVSATDLVTNKSVEVNMVASEPKKVEHRPALPPTPATEQIASESEVRPPFSRPPTKKGVFPGLREFIRRIREPGES